MTHPDPPMAYRHSDLRNRWTDIFRRDAFVHVAIMVAITAATFQGYLKDRIAGPLPYALADGAFMAAAAFWFAGLAIRHQPIRGPGTSLYLILAIIVVPTLYMLHPGTPLLIELAGLRAWVAYPVGCLMALTVIQNAAQARAYVGLVLALCIVTAVYGILQYLAGPDAALAPPLGLQRHGTTVFYNIVGTSRSEFRAFSTFTFPAPFAGMMVFGLLLAAGIAVSPLRAPKSRLLAALLVPLFFAGMTVSGTRAALLTLVFGLLVLGWYRGLRPGQLLLLPVLLIAGHVATVLTAGRVVERFASVFVNEGMLWLRVYAPLTIAGRALTDAPLGIGLGRTGIGVPFPIFMSQPTGFFIGSDGDIGRAAVEMGVFGLLLIAIIVFGIIPGAARGLKNLVGTPVEDIALGMGPLIVATGLIILVGSPLSAAPHGMIWWFFLGTLFKLTSLHSPPTPGARHGGHP